MDDSDNVVTSIVHSCKEYNSQLTKCMYSLNESLAVVNQSAEKSINMVNKYFNDLLESVTLSIKERQEKMLQKIDSLKSNVLKPLTQSMRLLEEKLMNSENILEECKAIKESKLDKVGYNLKLAALNRMTASVGSLPEIPALHNMPVLTVKMNYSCQNSIKKLLSTAGEVVCCAPVQFTSWNELPGSILLQWQEIEEEELEGAKFCIRYTRGDLKKNKLTDSFRMVYPGSDNSWIIRNLESDTYYSFQVSYAEETIKRNKIFSDVIWSYPLVVSTSFPHYQFSENLNSYSISCCGMNAHKIDDTVSIHESVLISSQPITIPLQSLLFKVLEVGDVCSPDIEGIGLIQKNSKSWLKEGSVVFNVKGFITVNGKKMVTQLPELSKGDTISISCEYVALCQRIRICIEKHDKQVTFDWKISSQSSSTPSSKHENRSNINFALCFFSKGWNISVQ